MEWIIFIIAILWSNGQTNATATNLSATTYTVIGTDTNSCQNIDSITITVNPLPNINISTTADTICFRDSVSLTASGASTYIWSNGLPNGAIFAPPTTATYTVTGTDTNGCQSTAAITIVVTPKFTVTQTLFSTVPNTSATIMQIVCATAAGAYDLQTTIPAGWVLTSGSTTISGNLSIGVCDTHFITIQIPSNPNLCNLAVENCVNLTAGSCAPVQNCLIINTGAMGMATIIPPSDTTFSQAIQDGLLLAVPIALTTPQQVVFQGNIICDIIQHPNSANTYTFDNSNIQIAPNVQVTILQGATLILSNTDVHGCTQLWRSITLNKGASLVIENASTIQDGLYAVEILHDNTNSANTTFVLLQNSTFRNNYAAIYTTPASSPNLSRLLLRQMVFEGGALIPALGPSIASGWAYAGILLNDFSILLMAGWLNGISTFDNLANGIVAFRSNININRAAVFRNIIPRGYGADGNAIFAKNDTSSPYSITVNGLGQTGAATFNNCRNGIISTASHLTVTNNNMTNMQGICIESRLAHLRRITITQNQISLFSNWNGIGINLLQNDGSPSILVSNNILEVGRTQLGVGLLNVAQGGIIVQEQLVNHPVNITQNTIRLFRASAGISLTSNSGARVLVNSIDFREPALVLGPPSSMPARIGVALNGCNGISLRCNNVLSNWNTVPILPNTTGISIRDTRVTADCNSMARTNTGMFVDGPACAGSAIRGNSFQRHNTGLHYTATAVTSAQSLAGNRWLGAWGSRIGARHFGIPTTSLYTVPSLTGTFMPPNRLPLAWFITGSGTQYSCLNNPCLPSPQSTPLALDNVDVAIVNNQIPQNPVAMPWELRRGLYNKLDKNPSFQNISVMGQFYNTYQNQAIGTVVETADARESVMSIDTTDAIVLEQHRTIHETIIDSLENLDSLYLLGTLSDSSWTLQRQQWLQQWLQNHNAASSLCNGLFGICQTQSQQALALNATIIYTNTPEENEQLVNDIYLQTVALGRDYFDTIQIQTLYNIAHQCPELGGTAVYRARSIYALIAYDTYNDNCDDLPQAKIAKINNTDTCYADVPFINPSLEGNTGTIVAPNQWIVCENTPEIGPYIPEMPAASDGNTYVGAGAESFIVYNESIGAMLADTLKQGVSYAFTADVFASEYLTNADTGTFFLWLGDAICQEDQLVGIITASDTAWTRYMVSFMANENYAYFSISTETTHPGYAYIDNLRPVPQPFGCDTASITNSLHPDKTDNTGDGIYTNVTTTKPSKFSIYPNPNQAGILTVEWQRNISNGVIVVLDALGREVGVYRVGDNVISQQIDIQHLPSGYYSVLLREEAQVVGREKLIVIKQ